jgi:hypothetical protein
MDWAEIINLPELLTIRRGPRATLRAKMLRAGRLNDCLAERVCTVEEWRQRRGIADEAIQIYNAIT